MTDPTDMTVFALMKSRLQMLSARQKLIAENVANVSTPGFTPRDIDQGSFAGVLQRIADRGQGPGPGPVRMAATQPGHMAPAGQSVSGASARPSPDSETTLDGNSVVIEEQMMKIAEVRTDFETMVGLYQKSLGLLRLAARSPTR
jgi:flagellar basal-body rod protein FlgB